MWEIISPITYSSQRECDTDPYAKLHMNCTNHVGIHWANVRETIIQEFASKLVTRTSWASYPSPSPLHQSGWLCECLSSFHCKFSFLLKLGAERVNVRPSSLDSLPSPMRSIMKQVYNIRRLLDNLRNIAPLSSPWNSLAVTMYLQG